jgi:DNA polymerase I
VHDAIMIQAPLDVLEEHIARLRWCMTEASRQILDGFEIRVDAKVFPHPHPFVDGRGVEMWDKIMRLVEQAEEKRKAAQRA